MGGNAAQAIPELREQLGTTEWEATRTWGPVGVLADVREETLASNATSSPTSRLMQEWDQEEVDGEHNPARLARSQHPMLAQERSSADGEDDDDGGEPKYTVGSSSRKSDSGRDQDGAPDAFPIDPGLLRPVDLGPYSYWLREVRGGAALQDTASPLENKRERVYNTMFHVPWRCELLIETGFLVCLDAFLFLFTILPVRVLRNTWQAAAMRRKGKATRLTAEDISDLARVTVIVFGVSVLNMLDVSMIYHWIRGQAVIKLYVIFNVLEVLDKLCQSFGADVLQVVFNGADRVATCSPKRVGVESLRLLLDHCIALLCFTVHAMVMFCQAIALNVAVNSYNNQLLTLLVSNNFSEVKGNVFKRLGKDNLHKMSNLDTVERFHIAVHLLFVLSQHMLKSEHPWIYRFFFHAGQVIVTEVTVDLVKHAFLAKFNEIKPVTYSHFLQTLCRQTMQSGSHQVHLAMSFVPLAPACVVVRVLKPLFLSVLPKGPPPLRLAAGVLLGTVIYVVLVVSKVLLGIGLKVYARWYLLRRMQKQKHAHSS